MVVSCAGDSCEKEGTLRCSKCKSVSYCSSECQKLSWKEHKEYCRHIAKMVEDNAPQPRTKVPAHLEKVIDGIITPHLPKFHEEYKKGYPKDKETYKLLVTEYQTAKLHCMDTSRHPNSLTLALSQFGSKRELLDYRWNVVTKELQEWIFDKAPKNGDIYTTCPIRNNVIGNMINLRDSARRYHHYMKKVPVASRDVLAGKTYVEVEFTDLQQIMYSNIADTAGAPVKWYGFSMDRINCARAKIVLDMMTLDVDARDILQVWYSTCLDKSAHTSMRNSCKRLATLEENKELKELFSFWGGAGLPAVDARSQFSNVRTASAHQNGILNLDLEVDRVDYCHYLATGEVFIKSDNKRSVGNTTMFCLPTGYESDMGCHTHNVRLAENIFFTLNFHCKNNNSQWCYKDSLMITIESHFISEMNKFKGYVREGKLVPEVRCAMIYPTNTEILQKMKDLKADEIGWNFFPEELSIQQFLEMADFVATTCTKQFFHLIDWAQEIYGASIIDYLPLCHDDFWSDDIFSDTGKAQRVLTKLKREFKPLVADEVRENLKSWHLNTKIEGSMHLAKAVLVRRYFKQYVHAFFGDSVLLSKDCYVCPWSPFSVMVTPLHVSFTLDKSVKRSSAPCDQSSCAKEGTLRCSRCRIARFCSVECQRASWKLHKDDCCKMVKLRAQIGA